MCDLSIILIPISARKHFWKHCSLDEMAYHDGQPFNDNMYRPCPMLENPQKLREMVEKPEHIPQIFSHRRVPEHLCAKCDRYAENWKPVAEEMWKEDQERKAAKKGC